MNNQKLISYSPELYYFFDSNEFEGKDYQKSIFVVAKTVAQWSDYYSAKLLSPQKGVKRIKKEGKLPTNDTCCWVLNLTEKEFHQLKHNLNNNNLPTDIFYESSRGNCVPNRPKNMIGKFFHSLGFKSYRCYTPKQWKIEKNKT